jgi:uncharacterized phage-like protein YoqJ
MFGMHEIIKVISSETPRITFKVWEEMVERGWRWEKNVVYIPTYDSITVIKALQEKYGHNKVAVGQPFHESTMAPTASNLMGFQCGIYVLDIESMIEYFRQELDDNNTINIWMGK